MSLLKRIHKEELCFLHEKLRHVRLLQSMILFILTVHSGERKRLSAQLPCQSILDLEFIVIHTRNGVL